MAIATLSSATPPSDPGFIKYLFNPNLHYDCYLLVGNPEISPPEKIGVVKQMLFAHSTVMRTDLQALNIKEKKPIEILDIFPHTFKNLLRFVYGFDTTDTLSFDDADNLLYAAEKYLIYDLKDKVAVRLMSLLNTENICSLMNNPACYQALQLNSQITKIISIETRQIFANPSFLELTADAFVKILEQDYLNTNEIEVWRSAIQWAKNKAKCDEGERLRTELVKPLKHIRLCTLSSDDFVKEVVTTKVLLSEEVNSVCLSIANREKQPKLTKICNEIQVRKGSTVKSSGIKKIWSLCSTTGGTYQCIFKIKTKNLAVEISSLILLAQYHPRNNGLKFNFTIQVEQKGHCESKTIVNFTSNNLYGEVKVPISTEGKQVLLLSNSQYKVNIYCNQLFSGFQSFSSEPDDEHFTITYIANYSGNVQPCLKQFEYKTLTPHL